MWCEAIEKCKPLKHYKCLCPAGVSYSWLCAQQGPRHCSAGSHANTQGHSMKTPLWQKIKPSGRWEVRSAGMFQCWLKALKLFECLPKSLSRWITGMTSNAGYMSRFRTGLPLHNLSRIREGTHQRSTAFQHNLSRPVFLREYHPDNDRDQNEIPPSPIGSFIGDLIFLKYAEAMHKH